MPAYLCRLPSTTIDLSNQLFRVLDRDTFPCLANGTLRRILIRNNQIGLVNLTLNTWILIDLSNNRLTQFPYSLFSSTDATLRSSTPQRTLLLLSNNFTEFDLIIYTWLNTFSDVGNNTFGRSSNGYHLLKNVQRQAVLAGSTLTNVSLPNDLRFLINDETAQNYGTCDSQALRTLIEILRSMKGNGATVDIECQCSSFYLKKYFPLLNSSTGQITALFSCANSSLLNGTQFESFTEAACASNFALSSSRLCQFSSSTPEVRRKLHFQSNDR